MAKKKKNTVKDILRLYTLEGNKDKNTTQSGDREVDCITEISDPR